MERTQYVVCILTEDRK